MLLHNRNRRPIYAFTASKTMLYQFATWILAIVTTSLIIVMTRNWLRRFIEHQKELKASAHKAEILESQLERANHLLYKVETRQNIQSEVKTELMNGWRGQAAYEGAKVVFQEMQTMLTQLASQTIQPQIELGVASAKRMLQEDNMKDILAAKKVHQYNVEELTRQNSQLKKQLESMKRREESIREKNRVRFEDGHDGSTEEPTQSRDEAVTEPFQRLHGSVTKPTQNAQHGFNTPLTRISGEIAPIFALQSNSRFSLRAEEINGDLSGRVFVHRSASGEPVGVFRFSDLQRGVIHHIPASDAKVVLCALPSCDVVSVAAQESKRCCSNSHATKLARLKAEEARQYEARLQAQGE